MNPQAENEVEKMRLVISELEDAERRLVECEIHGLYITHDRPNFFKQNQGNGDTYETSADYNEYRKNATAMEKATKNMLLNVRKLIVAYSTALDDLLKPLPPPPNRTLTENELPPPNKTLTENDF